MEGIQQLHRDLTVNNAEERCIQHIIKVYMDRNTDYRTSSNEVRKKRTGPHFARFFLISVSDASSPKESSGSIPGATVSSLRCGLRFFLSITSSLLSFLIFLF